MDKLKRVLERQVRELASGVLTSAIKRSAPEAPLLVKWDCAGPATRVR